MAEDGAFLICAEMDAQDVCTCASETLGSEVSADDLEVYDAIGIVFAQRMAAGEGWVAAWEASAEEVGKQLGIQNGLTARMNGVGRAHRDAIKACGG